MLNIIKLESRIVLDGAGVAEALDHSVEQDHHDSAIDSDVTEQANAESDSADIASACALLAETAPAPEPIEIVFVSDGLTDYQSLVDAASPESEVIVYDADVDTEAELIAMVTEVAESQNRPVESITILSHGGTGTFQLGNRSLTAEDIKADSDLWSSLSDVMTDDAKIYLYGCNVSTESGEGLDLLDALAEATGADVYGSDDTTGSGGDWDLEVASDGSDATEATPPLDLDALDDYSGQLAVPYIEPGFSQFTMDEDGRGGFTIVILDEDANTNPNTLLQNVISTDQNVVQNGTISFTYLGLFENKPGHYEYLIRFTPSADVVGTYNDLFRVTIQDPDNPTVTDYLDLMLTPENDAPILHNYDNDTADMEMNPIDEDSEGIPATTVAELIDSSTANGGNAITDVDVGDPEEHRCSLRG